MTMTPIIGLGEARRREESAKRRGEKYQVPDEVRAIRAAIQDKRDALMAQDRAAVEAKQQAQPDAILGVLRHASLDELAEFQRVAGQMDGRRLAESTGDLLRQRQRTGHQVAQESVAEALPPSGASTSRRIR